jgi:tetratricopeptide (TPR) repeat protein
VPKPRRKETSLPRSSGRVPGQLGLRIRKVRLELGLSLADVAGTDFSRSFLNQVELGRSRPSTRTLQIIADRLRRPIEYFLQDPNNSLTALELSLAEAGTRLRQGDAERARSLMTSLVDNPYAPPDIRARAQLLLGEALIRLGAAEEAQRVLESAIKIGDRVGWPLLMVELYDRLGSALYRQRRPNDAGRWWDRALSAYEDSGLADPVLKARLLGHRANLHYVAGQPTEAVLGYEAAIAAAGQVLDMQSLGGIYEGLALSLQRIGQFGRALDYAQRSLRLFQTLQDVRMTAQLRNNMAEILLEQRRPLDAKKLFLEGADELTRVGDQELLPHLLAGAAEAELELDDVETATARIAEALTAASRSQDPLAKLATQRVAGRIAHAVGRTQEAHAHFEAALEIAQAVGSPTSKSKISYDYAQILEADGESSQAIARYRQAYENRGAAPGA